MERQESRGYKMGRRGDLKGREKVGRGVFIQSKEERVLLILGRERNRNIYKRLGKWR